MREKNRMNPVTTNERMDAAMNQDSPATEAAYEDTLREIEDAVQEVTRLSRTSVSSERFLAELLQGAV